MTTTFAELLNRKHTDLLDAKINALCDALEAENHHNIDICRRLTRVALTRMNKERIEAREFFVEGTRNEFQGVLDHWAALDKARGIT